MFGIFLDAETRGRKKNERLFTQAARVYNVKKGEFRHELVNKLKFLHPNLKLLINNQSPYFFGYERDESVFVTGRVDDYELPSLSDLREQVFQDDFFKHVNDFVWKVKDYKNKSTWNRMMQHSERGEGYSYEVDLLPCEIRLLKNEKVIGRSGIFSPKHKGYFDEILYKHIVEDISGTGTSSLKLAIQVTNYGECHWDEITYVYSDTPRKSVTENIEHYTRICSLFTPFLKAIEVNLTDPSLRGQIWGPSDEDLDDRLIGLPANNRLVVDWI